VAPRGYCTVQDVIDQAAQRDVTLTAEQVRVTPDWIEAAEQEFDALAGRAWLVSSPVTGELHTLVGPLVRLRSAPVGAITAASVRSPSPGASSTLLVAGSGYELLDAARGTLLLAGWPAPGTLLSVSYTASTPPPARIRRVVAEQVVAWLRRASDDPGSVAPIRSVSLPGGIGVGYATATPAAIARAGSPDLLPEFLRVARSERGLVLA
jgi:hypothetical protein